MARIITVLALSILAAAGHAENLLSNGSFEKSTEGKPDLWSWATGEKCEASYMIDTNTARSGHSSIRLQNASPRKPNTYGMLTQSLRVSPNKRYTISCYVKTEDGGAAWIGGGRRWEHRFSFPRKTTGWQRITGSFNTGGGESQFTLRMTTESVTGGLWIDDVMLETGGVATPFLYEPPLAAGEIRMQLSPFDPGENLIPNASFEQSGGKCPAEWVWEQRNTDARLSLEKGRAGKSATSLKITSSTPFGAHVYSALRMAREVTVKPQTSYTISAFVKTGATTSGSWIGGGKGWKVRREIPVTNGEWTRLSHTFVTAEDETSFMLRVVTERPTKELWLDDISLREGVRPVPAALEENHLGDSIDLFPAEEPEELFKGIAIDTRWAPQRWPRSSWAFCGDEFKAEGVVTLNDAAEPAEVEIVLENEKGEAVARQQGTIAAGTQASFITLRVNLGKQAPKTLTLASRLTRNGKELAQHRSSFNLVTPERVLSQLEPVKGLRSRLLTDVEKLEARGLGAASRVTLTVLDNFIPWVESDLHSGQIDRAWDTVCLLEKMATRETALDKEFLAGERNDFSVPRYATGKLEVSHAQTIGTRRWPDDRTEQGPLFFTGYGHFNQVRRDVEKLPGYGCNFLQIEFGPRSVLPDEKDFDDRAINDFLAVCDRAAAANVAVNLLLSPHYFPQWALDKWPELKDCSGGFFKYCVHDPNARAVVERSLRHVIPMIKDHPAIHSLCLSNEPLAVDLQHCRITAKTWPAWLKKRHLSLENLNRRWATNYVDFASIPVPPPAISATPATLDFIRFNQESFAEFHRWMADVIHSMAPDMPVHAKIMMGAHFQKTLHGFWSVSPELFAGLSQYNGNDAYNMYSQNNGLWINGWRHCQAGYDFQRSMADLPVFNSENHIIVDRDHDAIPPEHLYSVLWQNAIHGQSSTTLWVWERTDSHNSGLSGSILHRPDCVEAVGRCNLDLNRLANEVAAIQNLPPSITLLWSPSSVVLGSEHEHHLSEAYEAANFLGQPLGFATERKLAELARTGRMPRPLDSTKVLILPEVTHLPDDARTGLVALQAAGVRIVVYGESATKSDYNEPRTPGDYETLPEAFDSGELFTLLKERAAAWNLPATWLLTDPAGNPVFGVEIRSASDANGGVASVCNHLREARTVSLAGFKKGSSARNLITGETLGELFVIKPMVPMLIEMR